MRCCHCADNVGDNVGDIAGMGADLFGSFAESTCAALVISSVSSLGGDFVSMSYPLMISAVGILVCLATTFVATDLRPARLVTEIESTLKMQLILSTTLATPVSCLPHSCISCHVKWSSMPALFCCLPDMECICSETSCKCLRESSFVTNARCTAIVFQRVCGHAHVPVCLICTDM